MNNIDIEEFKDSIERINGRIDILQQHIEQWNKTENDPDLISRVVEQIQSEISDLSDKLLKIALEKYE